LDQTLLSKPESEYSVNLCSSYQYFNGSITELVRTLLLLDFGQE